MNYESGSTENLVCYFIYDGCILQIYPFQNIGVHKSIIWYIK